MLNARAPALVGTDRRAQCTVDELEAANAIVASEEEEEEAAYKKPSGLCLWYSMIANSFGTRSLLESRTDERTEERFAFCCQSEEVDKKNTQTKHNDGHGHGHGILLGYFIFLSRLIQSTHTYIYVRNE